MKDMALGLVLVMGSMQPACICTRTFEDTNALTVAPTPKAEPAPEPEPEPEPEPKRVVVTADKIVITEKIQFDTGKATIKSDSFGLLDEIVQTFKDNPQIEGVSVEGHTDSVGSSKSNKKLSNDRAAAVMKYLTDKGIDKGRLTSKGFGEDKPIGDNETDEGKAKNRRVEFIITKQSAKKTTYEVDEKTGEKKEVK